MTFRMELRSIQYESVTTPPAAKVYINEALSGWLYSFDTHVGEVFVKIPDDMRIKDADERRILAARQAIFIIKNTEERKI